MKFPLCLTLFSILFVSCVTNKQFNNKYIEAPEPGAEVLIMTKDGKVITGHKITKHTNPWTIDGQPVIDEIIAYQDNLGYFKKVKTIFVQRLVKRKMNLYYEERVMGVNNGTLRYFYFEKEGSPLIEIGMSPFRAAVRDNEGALKLLNSYYPKENYDRPLSIEKILAIVRKYNE